MVEDKIRLLIVEARRYSGLSDALLQGAAQAIDAQGVDYDVITVSEAMQLPTAIALAEEAGTRPVGVRYDGFVALGVIIRGETYHSEVMANETARGLNDLSFGKRLAIGYGVVTVEEEDQAWSRARAAEGDRGGKAAQECLEIIGLKRQLLGQAR
jgi:6,7-dimethyl-8-ribityllumazine synthase